MLNVVSIYSKILDPLSRLDSVSSEDWVVCDFCSSIDNKSVKEDTDVRSYLYQNKKPGDSVTLTIERDGKEKSIDVKLKEQKSQTDFSLPSLSIVNVTESPGFLFWYK